MIVRILVVALALILIVYGVLIGRHAQEGEALFPFRILGEEVEYRLTPTMEGKIRLKLSRLEDKNISLRQDAGEQAIEKVLGKSRDFEEESKTIEQEIKKLKDDGKDTKNLDSNLNAVVDSHKCALEDALAAASGEHKAAVEERLNAFASAYGH